jgi:hypothetical protein
MHFRVKTSDALEILMWSGGAGALFAFWLVWPAPADKPAAKRVAMERRIPSAPLTHSTFRTELQLPKQQEWWNRNPNASQQVAVGHESRLDVTSTGSHSPAGHAAAAPISEGNAASDQTHETADATTGIEEFAAPTTTTAVVEREEPTLDPGAAPGGPSAFEQQQRMASEDERRGSIGEEDTNQPGGLALSEPRDPEPHVPPSHPESLNMPELPEPALVALTSELLSVELSSSWNSAQDEALVSAEAETERLNVTDVETSAPRLQMSTPSDNAPLNTVVQTQQGSDPQRTGAGASCPSGDCDALVNVAEERLARGDLAGARLFFGRAASSSDPRGALGMARTFDPETFRRVRVVGLRPDPDQAAQWYARAKVMQAVASAH